MEKFNLPALVTENTMLTISFAVYLMICLVVLLALYCHGIYSPIEKNERDEIAAREAHRRAIQRERERISYDVRDRR